MSCPRCGFPSGTSPCTLCGLTDSDTFELQRFHEKSQDRFEFTCVIKCSLLEKTGLVPNEIHGAKVAVSNEAQPRTYMFFEHSHTDQVYPVLEHLEHLDNTDWTLLINGRIRPFIQELWLPLFTLTETV